MTAQGEPQPTITGTVRDLAPIAVERVITPDEALDSWLDPIEVETPSTR